MLKLLALGLVCVALGFAQDQTIGRPVYRVAPNDHILVHAPQAEKLNGRIFQVDSGGFVTLPSLGRIRAGGLTLEELEKELASRLTGTMPSGSQVSISEVAYRK